MDKDFFCPEPYRNLSSKTHGAWMPCCVADDESSKFHNMNIETHKLMDFYNSDYMKKLKHDQKEGIMSNEVKTTCKKCISEEKVFGTSRRLRSKPKYFIRPNRFKLDVLKIKHIGNLCNVKCVMCMPEVSSLLAEEHYSLGLYNGPTIIKQEATLVYLEGLKEVLPKTNTLKFVGGEPLINPETWNFIEWLNKNNFHHLNLHFVTNTTKKFSKKQKDLLNRFNTISVSISIDAAGERNDYIRFPSKFDRVLEVANSYYGYYDTDLYTCISLLNIGYIDELSNIIHSKFKDIRWNLGSNIVVKPTIFRPDILPNKIKDLYIKKSNDFSDLLDNEEDLVTFSKEIQVYKSVS